MAAVAPLDVLQRMFNEVLVQTGKALRASQKDGANGPSKGALRTRMPDFTTTFNDALDDLESEITRAKAVLQRDLKKLQAARMPVVVPPQPVAPPAPMMAETKQPAAVMMDLPSTAAHTSANTSFIPKEDTKRVAPFPDMGMGLAISGDVVDLTVGDKKPAISTASPRVTNNAVKSARATPPVKPSPKPTPPAKVTPVTQPQIPITQPRTATPPVQKGPTPQQSAPSVAPAVMSLSRGGGAATADMSGGSELNFTNMQFSLAPSSDCPSQNAPPAPMQDFDISSFTGQDGGNDIMTLDVTGGGPAENNTPGPNKTQGTVPDTNNDNFFNLPGGNGVDNMDIDLSLGGTGGADNNNFDDMFFESNDADMDQFDSAYFGLE